MSASWLLVVLFVALAAMAVVLNQIQARLALVEVTLNEGLPPGYETASFDRGATPIDPSQVVKALGPGLHVFVSRTCHACQRLIDGLDHVGLVTPANVTLHAVDRPRPTTRSVAEALGATLIEDQAETAARVAADPLPHAIAVGAHGLIARGPVPTVDHLRSIALDGGIDLAVTAR